jgi:anti-sigma regulatory factor (Ser/Thr protein kinase)
MTAPLCVTVRRALAPEGSSPAVAVELRMPSLVAQVEAAVEIMVRHCFAGQSPCANTSFRLRVALSEALANAILRGNQEDPGKRVWVHAVLYPDTIRLGVRDEGSGFDPGDVPEPTTPDALECDGGRGLFIIRNLAERVEFNERGNTIWMTLPRC